MRVTMHCNMLPSVLPFLATSNLRFTRKNNLEKSSSSSLLVSKMQRQESFPMAQTDLSLFLTSHRLLKA